MKKNKKNKMGFTEKHLEILLNYCKATLKEPRITYKTVHKRLTKYVRLDSTISLLKKAYEREVITGPFLYANTGVEVSFMNDINDPIGFLKECRKNPDIIQAFALHGDWNFIQFKKGANTLEYVDSILPYKVSTYHIEDLTFEEKGKLPTDLYPHGWSEDHWRLFRVMSSPRKVKLTDIVKKTGIAYETIVKYFDDILKQSKIHSSFFPLSKTGYSHQVVTFKTDYEIGLLNALKKLDRTNYIYKTEGIIMLGLFIHPKPFDFNNSTDTFKKLEEKGYIRDVHICTPREWFQR